VEQTTPFGLYWSQMLNTRCHSRGLRSAALVVAVVHFASVTWVPVVHPMIHPDLVLHTPLSEVNAQTSGEEQLVLGDVMCVACMVSANALTSPYRLLQAPSAARKQPLVRQQVKWHPLHSFFPTNPARAPPSL